MLRPVSRPIRNSETSLMRSSIIDCYTYGNTPAAIILSRIVVEQESLVNDNISKKVGRIWGDYTKGINDLSKSNISDEFKKHLYRLWMDKYVIRCREANVPKIVQTFLENAMVTRFRIIMNEKQ